MCHATFCTTSDTFWPTSTLFDVSPPLRYGEPGGAGPGGARLQDALSRRVSRLPARADADLLAQGSRGAAHLRIPPGLPGRLLHLHWTTVPAGREPLEMQIQSRVRSSEKFPLTGKTNTGCLWHNPNNTDPHGTTTSHPAKSAHLKQLIGFSHALSVTAL